MRLEDFDYPLPKELIAQKPLEKRDESRLLVVDRKSGALSDRRFREIAEYFESGDVLVVNDTKVFPARILGKKKGTGGKVDVLLLTPAAEPGAWRCLIQPGPKEGQVYEFPGGAEATFLKRGDDDVPVVAFRGVEDVRALAEKIGTMPLPPYIKREPDASDVSQYQTVYAEKEGAVAAPTAGLHFTDALLDGLRAKGVDVRRVTLHVGYGTFKPVEDLEGHRMHSESFELTPETADAVNAAKSSGKKIWAVGTTSLRVLETCVVKRRVVPGKGETDLYIFPPFKFEAVDRLITNFHLPKTTLLLLVSAFMGEELRQKAYAHAVAERYRFYSYGDAMAIL
jgi:S-adenosylmethionine:tRNA ribosyltransferase-isomerase